MSASSYEQLLRVAFPTAAEARYIPQSTLTAYDDFRRAARPDVAFRFERVRLGVAMSLMKLLADLGDHEESQRVLEVLHKALGARSVADIDATITKDAKLFERLYTNLYVNEEGEQLLNLFERTLDADTQPLMEEIIAETVTLAGQLDFAAPDEDEE